jgi:hypothetical protein
MHLQSRSATIAIEKRVNPDQTVMRAGCGDQESFQTPGPCVHLIGASEETRHSAPCRRVVTVDRHIVLPQRAGLHSATVPGHSVVDIKALIQACVGLHEAGTAEMVIPDLSADLL